MKNITLIFIFMAFGLTSCASTNFTGNSAAVNYNEPFIFVEQGVEFAVYPNGEFDFYFNSNNPYRNRIIAPGRIMTYNSAYNYRPFVQYDDYGAVIQIETVPIYYDFYGRIIRAGNIPIAYNNFGKVSRIGNLLVYYNPNGQITATNGFINTYNSHYVRKPWHEYYRRPYSRNVIVYDRPYRAYYSPQRIAYLRYKNNFKRYRKSYRDFYRPGEQVSSYHHGRRSDNVRDLSEINNNYSETYQGDQLNNREVRSNQNSRRVQENSRNSNDTSIRRSREPQETSIRGRNDNRSTESNVRKSNSRTPVQKVERSTRDNRNTNEVRRRPVRRTSRSGDNTAVRQQSRTTKAEAATSRSSRSSRGRD